MTSKGANRSQISEGWELSFPIGGADTPRIQGHPVINFIFLSFFWLGPEDSPNTKVFREVAQLKPKIWGRIQKRGALRNQHIQETQQKESGSWKQSHKVVSKIQGPSQSLTDKGLILIRISKTLWTEQRHKLPTGYWLNMGYDTNWTYSKTITKALKAELTLEPQPTEDRFKFMPWTWQLV